MVLGVPILKHFRVHSSPEILKCDEQSRQATDIPRQDNPRSRGVTDAIKEIRTYFKTCDRKRPHRASSITAVRDKAKKTINMINY